MPIAPEPVPRSTKVIFSSLFLNLSEIPNEIIIKLRSYCDYLRNQNEELIAGENDKKDIEVSYF